QPGDLPGSPGLGLEGHGRERARSHEGREPLLGAPYDQAAPLGEAGDPRDEGHHRRTHLRPHRRAEISVDRPAMIRRVIAACRNALPAGLFVLSVSATTGIIVVDGRLSDLADRVKPGAEEEMRRFHVQMRIDETVEKLLAELADDTEGDRALVYLA